MVDIYVGPENTHWYLHERLLCYYSPFFANIFYADDKNSEKQQARRSKSYGLPDEEDLSFELLVGWLYSRSLQKPNEEKEVGSLLDLYLLSQKFQMEKLGGEVVEAVSYYYHTTGTYPGLRRVQYVYANTDEDNEMREMMVGAVAKQLATGDKVPAHWASALQRNGQLAVDIIRSIQQWHIEDKAIPDARDSSISRGRTAKGGFSAIEREGESIETEATTAAMSNMGVESINSGHENEDLKGENSAACWQFYPGFGARDILNRRPISSSWSSPTLTQASPPLHSPRSWFSTNKSKALQSFKTSENDGQVAVRPQNDQRVPNIGYRRRVVVTFAEQDYTYNLFETEIDPDEEMPEADTRLSLVSAVMKRPESIVISVIWLIYVGYLIGSTNTFTRSVEWLKSNS